jgi:cohesin complex subunit SCC1
VDLPADSHAANPDTLLLPETLTEMELFAPMQDLDALLAGPDKYGNTDDHATDLNWGTQELLTNTIENPRSNSEPRPLDDDGLLLDLEFDIPQDDSIEFGRRAPEPLDNEPTLLQDHGLELGFGQDASRNPSAMPGMELDDLQMDDFGAFEDTTALGGELHVAKSPTRERDGLSPLSDIHLGAEQDLDTTFQQNADASVYEPQDETIVEAAQRVKRRRILQLDASTELPSNIIREQQNDRSKILKPSNFLPRDPMLLALLNLQKNGGFISSILGDGRSIGWAPELRSVLSVEVVRRSGERKRKRDSGIADTGSDEAALSPKSVPELQFEDDEFATGANAGDLGLDDTVEGGLMEEIPSDNAVQHADDFEHAGDFGPGSPMAPMGDDFDQTTLPLLHPADAGPISQGTRHAVHLLRDHFGPEGETSPSKRQKAAVVFQDLLPEKRTNVRDATKMFFEVLVLATKDAVKVEQSGKNIGGPIKIRAKRGLYGTWAEERAAGSMETGTQAVEGAEVEEGDVEA